MSIAALDHKPSSSTTQPRVDWLKLACWIGALTIPWAAVAIGIRLASGALF